MTQDQEPLPELPERKARRYATVKCHLCQDSGTIGAPNDAGTEIRVRDWRIRCQREEINRLLRLEALRLSATVAPAPASEVTPVELAMKLIDEWLGLGSTGQAETRRRLQEIHETLASPSTPRATEPIAANGDQNESFSYRPYPVVNSKGITGGFRITNGRGFVIADVYPLTFDGRAGEMNARLFVAALRPTEQAPSQPIKEPPGFSHDGSSQHAKALAELAAECERANTRTLSQIGMGLIDLNAIKRANDTLASQQQAEPPVAQGPTAEDLIRAINTHRNGRPGEVEMLLQDMIVSGGELTVAYDDFVTMAKLLATPPAATPPVAEPLSDAEILEAFQRYGTGRLDGFTAAVRAILSKQTGSST